jgi:SAM-dependent methyltransferase/diadenosine tetraphosphate (Ap4A) HIT family hydrolase
MTTWSVADCELCNEVVLAGTHATSASEILPSDRPFSRLIRRTTIVDIIAGLGSVIPGYVLLVPRRHVASCGELHESEIRHIYDVAWEVAAAVRSNYDCEVAVIEHGSSGDPERFGRACITHSHIHIFPLPRGRTMADLVPTGSIRVSGYSGLLRLAASCNNYYYCANMPYDGYLLAEPHLPSQYARRRWAALLGRPEEWDWAVFPFIENCRKTALTLRSDTILPVGSDLAETLRAYADSADWYAERTSTFPPGSSLPHEIDTLSRLTSGPVLDAGSGPGRDAQRFRASGSQVIALDASEPLLQRMSQSSRSAISRVLGDVRALPFANETFGAIWCSAVLLHLDASNVAMALREFWRVLRPDGLAQISVKAGHGHTVEPVKGGIGRRHFYFYEMEELVDLVCTAGFRTVSCWTEAETDFGDNVQTWNKVLIERNRL